jgi:hypothetical protein
MHQKITPFPRWLAMKRNESLHFTLLALVVIVDALGHGESCTSTCPPSCCDGSCCTVPHLEGASCSICLSHFLNFKASVPAGALVLVVHEFKI